MPIVKTKNCVDSAESAIAAVSPHEGVIVRNLERSARPGLYRVITTTGELARTQFQLSGC